MGATPIGFLAASFTLLARRCVAIPRLLLRAGRLSVRPVGPLPLRPAGITLAPFSLTVLEDPLHRFAVVGAVGSDALLSLALLARTARAATIGRGVVGIPGIALARLGRIVRRIPILAAGIPLRRATRLPGA